jgi:hypothetical protein
MKGMDKTDDHIVAYVEAMVEYFELIKRVTHKYNIVDERHDLMPWTASELILDLLGVPQDNTASSDPLFVGHDYEFAPGVFCRDSWNMEVDAVMEGKSEIKPEQLPQFIRDCVKIWESENKKEEA